MKKKRVRLVKYVNENIENCTINSKIQILNMITQKIGVDNIYEEGTGIRILYSKIPGYLLQEIVDFVKEAIKETELKFSDSD